MHHVDIGQILTQRESIWTDSNPRSTPRCTVLSLDQCNVRSVARQLSKFYAAVSETVAWNKRREMVAVKQTQQMKNSTCLSL